MTEKVCPVTVRPDGTVQLPRVVRRALHLRKVGGMVGFLIEGSRVRLVRTRIVPDVRLSDKDIALLARYSKQRVGKRSFRTTEAALRHLWSL